MNTLSLLKSCSVLFLAVGSFPAACPALVPALPAVKAMELYPPNVTPIAAKELPPYSGKPVAAVELKSIAAVEAPYEYQTAQLTQQVVASKPSNTRVSSDAMVSAPEPAAPVYTPVVHPPGATAADYNPQEY